MASITFKIHAPGIKTTDRSNAFSLHKALFQTISIPKHHQYHFKRHYSSDTRAPFPSLRVSRSKFPLSPRASVSSSSPPVSKEEAILQAKTCLSSTLEKPLNNPRVVGKFKKAKQPRFRVEIPVMDDSPSSVSQLAFDVFHELPVKRKGSSIKFLILWPDSASTEAAIRAFESGSTSHVGHLDSSSIGYINSQVLNSADVVVFMSPNSSQMDVIKTVTENVYPKPAVLFNPRWPFEEEDEFGELKGFVGSFDVIYSFVGLEVRGVLSKRKGMIFKCVRDGVLSGERWNVFVEEDGEMKVVSRFGARPSIGEVENVLYNLMAMNSPLTKSAKFLRSLVSNVTGKK